jgi:Na+/H+ antiporter NhaD/arsenite permease-like protein
MAAQQLQKRNRTLLHLLTLLLLGAALLMFLPTEGVFSAFRVQAQMADESDADQPETGISLTGRLIDPQGEPIEDAEIELILNGNADDQNAKDPPVESQPDGTFVIDLPIEIIGTVETLELDISRAHFDSLLWQAAPKDIERLNQGESLRLPDLELSRRVTAAFWVAAVTFAGILIIIAFERLHNTMAALLGVAIVLGVSLVGGAISQDLFVFDFERALGYVNFDVIFLVLGMMIVIGVIEETGIFQWLAYQSYRLSGGRPWLLVMILMLITAVASALLDNVTTMLLMTPITIQIALAMEMSPLLLLLPEVLASNIGGISTLIGTPTNILIGAYANLSFNDFLTNLTPGVLMALVLLAVYILLRYRNQFRAEGGEMSETLLSRLRESGKIAEPDRLRMSGFIFFIMLVAFVLGESIHLVPAVTALLGAVAMLLWVSPDVESMLKVVDWTTLVFFISLFIVVGAIQEVGLIALVAEAIGRLVGDNLTMAIVIVVWSSAILSGVIANIPFTAAMLPVVGFLTATIPGASNNVLYYALSVGSAMGGNSTLIGASANLVTAGIAERAGYRITYGTFFKIGAPAMIITVTAGMLWLLFWF